MSNLIQTAEDMYREFLRGIRKENTSVVTPSVFNKVINGASLRVIKQKLPTAEFNQKRIDDLEVLRVVTDGGSGKGSYPILVATHPGVFPVPKVWHTTDDGQPIDEHEYPLYLHGVNVMFKKVAETEWTGAFLRRSDSTAVSNGNPYRVPAITRIYYEMIGGYIRMFGGDQQTQMRLEYYRYGKIINYSTTEAENLDPEFGPSLCQEITDEAIRLYLEWKMDPRYKSFLNEGMLQSQSK